MNGKTARLIRRYCAADRENRDPRRVKRLYSRLPRNGPRWMITRRDYRAAMKHLAKHRVEEAAST